MAKTKGLKRIISMIMSLVMVVLTFGSSGITMNVKAQQVPGRAPFINSWLISGPFDTPVADQIYDSVVPENPNLAQKAKPSVSSATFPTNTASYLIDGTISNQWVTEGTEEPCWAQLDWENPITVGCIGITLWADNRHINKWYDLIFTYEDGSTSEKIRVDCTVNNASAPTIYQPETPIEGVKSVQILVDEGRSPYPNITGISEIEVYQYPLVEEMQDEATSKEGGTITPILGETLTDNGQEWEYFDDRIYNRNYDDYQDLNGYYAIKQDIDTKNKFVYAHTYVWSDKEQDAQVRVGASGSYRVYFNDKAITKPSVPSEVQKDMSIQTVTLKEGWNKLLIQIEHTYTEDTNSNGVPIAKDAHVSYLGFYGRITDASGNAIDGLVYSVEGGKAGELEITTQGLKEADGFPENTLPTGYKEWPYVWNKSTTSKAHGLSASAFQFMANGGTPGYTWKVKDGELPGGLVLNEDGTIEDGLKADGMPDLNSDKGIIPASCAEGDYTFTIQVTDASGNTAEKEFTITVKERPNKWFEEGRVGALSHCITIPTYFVDPNFSADLWAERAKHQGHSLVSIEALQQNYYWPSKFADPKHDRNLYMPKDENGQVVDGLKQFEEAVKRYGIKFGLYYATEGGGLQHYSTDVFVQNVADLIKRYDPAYLYFDGPQAMRSANYDVMYSNVRNYNNDIIINSNAWGEEFGDPDLGTHEASGIYSNVGRNHFVKKVVFEPWKSVHTKNNPTPYYARRDDYVQIAKEMVMNVGRGYTDNNDQMPLMSRGTNWDTPQDVATRYPKSVQEFIDVRENVAAWFAPEGYTERHESTTGTTPYFLSGYGYEDDGKGNYENFAFPNENIGPKWGYAVSRDNNIYLHIIEGPDGKRGFNEISNNTLTISPVEDQVTSVIWLNKDQDVASFKQEGNSLTIDLSNVEADKADTIIKIVTDKTERKYKLTNIYVEGEPVAEGKLQLKVEGQMTYPALKANLEQITYQPATDIVSVDDTGLVTPMSDGTTVVTVTGTYEGVTLSEEITVTVKDGVAFVNDEILSTVLHIEDREIYGEFSCFGAYDVSLEGRSVKGGATGLNDAEVIWHAGTVDLTGGDKYEPIKIIENDILRVVNGKVIPKIVKEQTRVVLWADVIKDGVTYTSNRVYMDLRPTADLAEVAVITASENEELIPNLTDKKVVNGTSFDASKWTANGESWLTFELPEKAAIKELDIHFNTRDQSYINTPDTITIQTSEDGNEWTTQQIVNGPTGSAWFGFYTPYAVDLNTKYVRLQFAGRNGGASDIMEVKLMGEDISNTLSRIELDPKVSEDHEIIVVDITGFDNIGNSVDLTGSEIKVISEDTSIVKVNEDNTLSPVSPGRTSIQVQVLKDYGYAENSFYVIVDNNGKLQLLPYLSEVLLGFKSDKVAYGAPTVAVPEIKLSDGSLVPTVDADISYVISDNRLQQVEGTNTIVLTEEVEQGFVTTVKAVVTYDGITVSSNEVPLTVVGSNLAASAANVSVSSVRDRNGNPNGDNVDERYVGSKAVDGDKNTQWAAKQADNSPWIRLDFDDEVEIGSVNLLDRGHEVNAIVEGVLEFFDIDENVIYTQNVTGIQWDGVPDNMVVLEEPVSAYAMKFAIDPENKYHQSGSERGLTELQVFAPEKDVEKAVVEVVGVNVVTQVSVIPTLPSEDVVVVYNTGEKDVVSITWNVITQDDVAEVGSFAVEGVITGTDMIVSTIVNVIDKPVEPQPEYATVTFDANGGEVSVPSMTVEKGKVYGTLPTPTREGYKFVGWYNEGTLVTGETICDGDVTLTAEWEKETDPEPQPEYVTITFKANGGIVSESSRTVEKGTAYGTLPTATRNGYNFLGWYNGSTRVKSTDLCNKDVTLNAKWEKTKPQQKYVIVTFNANGGNVSTSIMAVEKGKAYGTLPTATRDGYKFLGWYNGTTLVKSTDICNKDVTLMAKWEKIKDDTKPVTKITLNETKKSIVKGTSFTLQAIVEPYNATNKNVIWTSSNTKVATVDVNGKVTAKGNGKATIKATAADGSEVNASCDVTVAYKITYVMNKGENHESNPSMYYETKVSLKAPSRKGYTFKGWYTDKKLKNKINSISASSSKDITVYAKWEKIKVGKVTVKNAQSKVAGTMTVNYTKVKNVSGYEIVYGTNSKITKNKKTITTKSSSVTIKKLKKGGTYYVKVRAYKKDSSGKNVYGNYSKVMKVQIKK